MITNFRVSCDFYVGSIRYYFSSKVYAIDSLRDRFLVADADGDFHWVDIKNCELED